MFPNGLFPDMAADATPIGLGCSRLGSVNGATGDEARALLGAALDGGIRFFDTSNIYGQGDSERLIGEVLAGRSDCVICSKAGKYFSWPKRVLLPVKGLARAIVRRSEQASRGVAAARSKPMPTCWGGRFLSASLEESLKRLARAQIDLFMLHSPDADTLRRGDAVEALETARLSGKIGVVGVSVDDVAAANAALDDTRVRVLQVPLQPGDTAIDAVLARAASSGVAIVAREILGGRHTVAAASDPAAFANERIADCVQRQDIALPLIGATRLPTLRASIAAAQRASSGVMP